MDEKAFVRWPHGWRPTRDEALAMARELVEQMEAQRLLREAFPAELESDDEEFLDRCRDRWS